MRLTTLTLLTATALFAEDQLLVVKPVPKFHLLATMKAPESKGSAAAPGNPQPAASLNPATGFNPAEVPNPDPDAKDWPKELEGIIKLAEEQGPVVKTQYIVHIVKYNDDAPVIEWQRWFAYDADWKTANAITDPRRDQHFKESRLYGGKAMRLVYAHYNVKGEITTVDAVAARGTQVEGNPTAEEVVTDIRNELKGLGTKKVSFNVAIREQGGNLVAIADGYNKLVQVAYRVSVTNRTPGPQSNLKDILSVAFNAQGEGGKLITFKSDPLVVTGAGDIRILHEPADLDVHSFVDANGDKPVEIAKQTYLVEKKYNFDFGFALPINSPESLTYDSQGGRAVPKKIERQNVYAVISWYPWKVDLTKTSYRLTPGFMVGLPISGKPFSQQLYAVSFGLWKIEVFGGVLAIRSLRPINGSSDPAALYSHWNYKGAFGVNVPVKSVVDALKPARK